jgi:hypothetical protein
MQNLPDYITILFILTTLMTIYLFYRATGNSLQTLLILISWLLIQGIVSLTGFYTSTHTFPPRFVLLALPPLLVIVLLFLTNSGRKYIDSLDYKMLTLLHVIRIPVEIVLFLLFLNGTIPQLMTFEGRNFDILAGITAPIVFYWGFIKMKINKNILLLWNFVCLVLLINIVVNAILSAPSVFQKFAFEQPNRAILYFPFTWLPSSIVPLVLLSHLATIRHLVKK